MKFVTMATALVAVSMTLSSCWRADDAVELPTEVKDVAAEQFSVVASANAEATFTVDVQATKKDATDKKSALFTEIDNSNKTVKVTATLVNPAGFVESTQTATVNFSGSMRSAVVAFDFAKASTDIKTQAEVAAATTDVVVKSETTNDIKADMTIPAGVEVTGNTTDPFSVTAYESTPSIVDADDIKVGQPLTTSDEESKVMVLDCTPSGATFSEPVTLKVFVGTELAGEEITVENNGEKLTGVVQPDGNVEFKVSHFSQWNVLFIPIVAKVEKHSVNIASMSGVSVSRGKNTYKFNKRVGVNYSATGLMEMFITAMFGEKELAGGIEDEGSFDATDAGTATIKVDQNYTDYTFRFGTKTFTATVWGGTVSTINIVGGGSGSNAHSGGSGN